MSWMDGDLGDRSWMDDFGDRSLGVGWVTIFGKGVVWIIFGIGGVGDSCVLEVTEDD